MTSYVYEFEMPGAARRAVRRLVASGISEEQVSLMMRHKLERRTTVNGIFYTPVFVDALRRGLAIGGVAGLFLGVMEFVFREFGIAAMVPGPLALVVEGAACGAGLALAYAIMRCTRRWLLERRAHSGILLVVNTNGQDDALVRRLMRNSEYGGCVAPTADTASEVLRA
jgi:hypothetical protein